MRKRRSPGSPDPIEVYNIMREAARRVAAVVAERTPTTPDDPMRRAIRQLTDATDGVRVDDTEAHRVLTERPQHLYVRLLDDPNHLDGLTLVAWRKVTGSVLPEPMAATHVDDAASGQMAPLPPPGRAEAASVLAKCAPDGPGFLTLGVEGRSGKGESWHISRRKGGCKSPRTPPPARSTASDSTPIGRAPRVPWKAALRKRVRRAHLSSRICPTG